MKIELTRFKIKEGKSGRVDEWLKMINDRMPEALATLKDEKMYFETIFRDKNDDGDFLWWLDVRGEGGIKPGESKHQLDIDHRVFFEECIDRKFGKFDLYPEVALIPEDIRKLMGD